MTILEIISGVLLILASIAIVILVLLQDSKGNGLAGVIGGGYMMMMDGRSRTPSSLMVKYTKVAAVVLFVLTIGVNVISALAK